MMPRLQRDIASEIRVVTVVTRYCERMGRVRWVFLAYRTPPEPSTPRIAAWLAHVDCPHAEFTATGGAHAF